MLSELGPLVTALLFAGRIDSGLTVEIGLMQVTDQISSMEMLTSSGSITSHSSSTFLG